MLRLRTEHTVISFILGIETVFNLSTNMAVHYIDVSYLGLDLLPVLVSAGTALIFFLVPGTVLYFEFSM